MAGPPRNSEFISGVVPRNWTELFWAPRATPRAFFVPFRRPKHHSKQASCALLPARLGRLRPLSPPLHPKVQTHRTEARNSLTQIYARLGPVEMVRIAHCRILLRGVASTSFEIRGASQRSEKSPHPDHSVSSPLSRSILHFSVTVTHYFRRASSGTPVHDKSGQRFEPADSQG